jgi:hypothetical protein
MPTAVFYNAEDGSRAFGRAAIASYVDGHEGRLMRSIKSILGSDLMDEATELPNGLQVRFIDVVVAYQSNVTPYADDLDAIPVTGIPWSSSRSLCRCDDPEAMPERRRCCRALLALPELRKCNSSTTDRRRARLRIATATEATASDWCSSPISAAALRFLGRAGHAQRTASPTRRRCTRKPRRAPGRY